MDRAKYVNGNSKLAAVQIVLHYSLRSDIEKKTMKFSAACVYVIMAASAVSSFAPLSGFGMKRPTTIFAEAPEASEEDGMDLNLEEMFDIFDAADKGKDFDDTIKEVKGE